MSKNYFTKYLPIEGEAKEGDMVPNPSRGTIPYEVQSILSDLQPPYHKVKLHLCSRIVPREQTGNIVYHERLGWGKLYSWALSDNLHIQFDNVDYSESEWEHSNILNSKGELYFVIGRCSELATWVKEGDEFEEDEIQIRYLMGSDKKFSLNGGFLVFEKKSEDSNHDEYFRYDEIGTYHPEYSNLGDYWRVTIQMPFRKVLLPKNVAVKKDIVLIKCPTCKTFH